MKTFILYKKLKQLRLRKRAKDNYLREKEVREDAVRRLTLREATMSENGLDTIGVALCLDNVVVGFIRNGEGDATKKLLELREYYLKTLGPRPQIELR